LTKYLNIIVFFSFILTLTACTLRIGGPNKLPNSPAPTTQPLEETSQATLPAGLIAPKGHINLPPGFVIAVFAEGLKNPRMMVIGPDGHLYVAERGEGRIVRLPDRDHDGNADSIEVVAQGLNSPSSIAFHQDGSLYIGETTRILQMSEPDATGFFRKTEIVVDGLPSGGHSTRTVLFSPDWETLFVSVGSSCNVCDEKDERRATIMAYKPDGSDGSIFARGLRNAVGITFRPGTNTLWAANNGRDMLGDDLPPETIYIVTQGSDYGWPRCHSGRIIDPEFGTENACDGVVEPIVEMQAHSAPLGLEFYSGSTFPVEYQGDLFVAFHGSWNRSIPTGYKVVRIPIDGNNYGPVQDFATGWLVENSSWGRPVDVTTGPNGELFISDDSGGFIYQIIYLPE